MELISKQEALEILKRFSGRYHFDEDFQAGWREASKAAYEEIDQLQTIDSCEIIGDQEAADRVQEAMDMEAKVKRKAEEVLDDIARLFKIRK